MIIEELKKAENLTEAGKVNAALKILKNLDRPRGFEGRWYYLNGEAWRLKGIFHKAIAAYKSALTCGVPNAGLLCQTLIRTAACHRALGREKQAFAFASAAVKASRKAPALISEAKLELAMAYRLKGDFKKAAAMLAGLLTAYLKEKDYPAAAFILWALGGLYRLQGRYALSIEAFKRSGAYAAKARDRALRGQALLGNRR
ncbi:MAG: tetratricopeptide repeat protein [Elusimicrobia bacterium]|nr:tetratricopeptide repeat protein [Elusimicrobiota bacterium]